MPCSGPIWDDLDNIKRSYIPPSIEEQEGTVCFIRTITKYFKSLEGKRSNEHYKKDSK